MSARARRRAFAFGSLARKGLIGRGPPPELEPPTPGALGAPLPICGGVVAGRAIVGAAAGGASGRDGAIDGGIDGAVGGGIAGRGGTAAGGALGITDGGGIGLGAATGAA